MSFDTMTRLVVHRVRQAPHGLIVEELREAAIRFFERTEVWRKTLDPIAFSADQTEAELVLPEGTALVSVPSGTIDGDDLAVVGYKVSLDAPESLVLESAPTRAVEVVVEVVLKPSYTSTEIPSARESEHARAIASGAIAALKAMRGAEWYDPEGAAISLDEFKREIAEARRRRFQAKVSRSLRVSPVSFF
jgi:hypothetical protein